MSLEIINNKKYLLMAIRDVIFASVLQQGCYRLTPQRRHGKFKPFR